MTFSLITATADRLRLTAFTLANSPRAMRILRHYNEQIERGRMNPWPAVDRCVLDICGNANGPGHDTRTEAIL